jgi:hypothetical protein
MKKKTAIFLMMVLTAATPVMAEGTAGDYFSDMGKQVYRGLRDVVTSPAEIPCTMAADIKDDGALKEARSDSAKDLRSWSAGL